MITLTGYYPRREPVIPAPPSRTLGDFGAESCTRLVPEADGEGLSDHGSELRNFEGVGQLLVALRISQGISQRELAERLSVHESQVSRDERNEYHGVTVERAQKVLDALGVEIRTTVEKVGGQLLAAG